ACRAISFFFFQAEDGIRDFHVTGVQTCALPICNGQEQDLIDGHTYFAVVDPNFPTALGLSLTPGGDAIPLDLNPLFTSGNDTYRSEERRVGKECRSRWSADQQRKSEHAERRRGQ